MVFELSRGAIARIAHGKQVMGSVLQVLFIERKTVPDGTVQIRLLLSDGVKMLFTFMLSSDLHPLIENGTLAEKSVCRINSYTTATPENLKKMYFITDLEVLGVVADTIGYPLLYIEMMEGASRPSTSRAASHPPQSHESGRSPATEDVPRQNLPEAVAGPSCTRQVVARPPTPQEEEEEVQSRSPAGLPGTGLHPETPTPSQVEDQQESGRSAEDVPRQNLPEAVAGPSCTSQVVARPPTPQEEEEEEEEEQSGSPAGLPGTGLHPETPSPTPSQGRDQQESGRPSEDVPRQNLPEAVAGPSCTSQAVARPPTPQEEEEEEQQSPAEDVPRQNLPEAVAGPSCTSQAVARPPPSQEELQSRSPAGLPGTGLTGLHPETLPPSHRGDQQESGRPAGGPAAKRPCLPSSGVGRSSVPNALATAAATYEPKVVRISRLTSAWLNFTICARVTHKGQIRTWKNNRGTGKLFSVVLADESGEIKATAFNDLVDKFFPLIEMDKVYYLSKGQVKRALKQCWEEKIYYEIALVRDTSVVPCRDSGRLPPVPFDFVPIKDLVDTREDSLVDVIGVCRSYDRPIKLTTNASGGQVLKRNIHLMDMSGKVVTVVLWGSEAQAFDGSLHPVVAIRKARVSSFGARSLSVLASSCMVINPDRPEAIRLRAWYDGEGRHMAISPISAIQGAPIAGRKRVWKTLQEVTVERLSEEYELEFSNVSTVTSLKKEGAIYPACPNELCGRALVPLPNSQYLCESCNFQYPHFRHRLRVKVEIVDSTGSLWVTCFDAAAEQILRQSTARMVELMEKDKEAFKAVFKKALHEEYEFDIRTTLEMINGQSYINATAMEVRPPDTCQE